MPEIKPKEEDEPWLTIKQLGELLQIGEDKIRARIENKAGRASGMTGRSASCRTTYNTSQISTIKRLCDANDPGRT